MWIKYGIAALLTASIYSLIVKHVGFQVDPSIFVAKVFGVQAALLFLFLIFKKIALKVPMWIFISTLLLGVFSAVANYFEVKAFNLAPNVGYVAAIKLGQVLIVTLLGDFASGNKFTTKKDIFWSIILFLGLVLVALNGISFSTVAFGDMNWVWYALATMALFATIILFSRYLCRYADELVVLFWMLFATACALIPFAYTDLINLYSGISVQLNLTIFSAGIVGCLFNYFYIKSLKLAPNPGFAISINSGQLIIITIVGMAFFEGQTITVLGALGMAIALIGACKILLRKKVIEH